MTDLCYDPSIGGCWAGGTAADLDRRFGDPCPNVLKTIRIEGHDEVTEVEQGGAVLLLASGEDDRQSAVTDLRLRGLVAATTSPAPRLLHITNGFGHGTGKHVDHAFNHGPDATAWAVSGTAPPQAFLNRFSAVHVHSALFAHQSGYMTLCADTIRAVSLWRRTKQEARRLVVTVHDWQWISPGNPTPRFDHIVPKVLEDSAAGLFGVADRIVFPTNYIHCAYLTALELGGSPPAWCTMAHPDIATAGPPVVPKLPAGGRARVIFVGHATLSKGIGCFRDVAAAMPELQFVVLGDLSVEADVPRLNAMENMEVLGAYHDGEVFSRLAAAVPTVVWYPSEVPETWCYSATIGLASRLPVLYCDHGAVGRRFSRERDGARGMYVGYPPGSSINAMCAALRQVVAAVREQDAEPAESSAGLARSYVMDAGADYYAELYSTGDVATE